MRPPRWDSIAVKYSNLIFGSRVVSGVLKKYHRSRVSMDALQDDVFEYNCKLPSRPNDDPIYIAALQSVRREFVPQIPIIPLTIGAASKVSTVPKDKSPGLPWKLMGFKTKEDVFADDDAMRQIRKDWILIGRGYHVRLPDCLVYARAQICDPSTNKVRATWGYPTGVFIEEARFVYPYLDFLKNRRDDYPLAYGVEIGKGGMGYVDEMFHRAGSGVKAVMTDWRRFDKQIPAWLVRDAFALLKECFRTDVVVDVEGKVWPVNSHITNARWSKMVQYFINTPFRMPDGSRYMKSHGVPSGSCFTNIIDSIINAVVTRYCVYQTTGSFPEYDLYMGDDSVFVTRGVVNLDDIASVADETFGFTLNVKKSYVTSERTNVQFLGYFNDSGYPIRDQDFLIASFCLPERVQEPDPIFTATRAVGQMWSTLNGIAAQKWLLIIQGIENEYSLSPQWFVDHMAEYPNSLKFLRLHGLDANSFPQPGNFDVVDAPMRPPFRPFRRNPVRRVTDVKDLYYQYVDDPIRVDDWIGLERDDIPPDIEDDVLC
uniref:RdRp n=1 Tax=Partitivirus-like 3 TaxID=1903550 RepID=A0A1C9U5D1_9VIRU|nr:RdRp [Partitivirus-like 3]